MSDATQVREALDVLGWDVPRLLQRLNSQVAPGGDRVAASTVYRWLNGQAPVQPGVKLSLVLEILGRLRSGRLRLPVEPKVVAVTGLDGCRMSLAAVGLMAYARARGLRACVVARSVHGDPGDDYHYAKVQSSFLRTWLHPRTADVNALLGTHDLVVLDTDPPGVAARAREDVARAAVCLVLTDGGARFGASLRQVEAVRAAGAEPLLVFAADGVSLSSVWRAVGLVTGEDESGDPARPEWLHDGMIALPGDRATEQMLIDLLSADLAEIERCEAFEAYRSLFDEVLDRIGLACGDAGSGLALAAAGGTDPPPLGEVLAALRRAGAAPGGAGNVRD